MLWTRQGRTQQDGNSGQTALHVACWNVQEPVVKLLVGSAPRALLASHVVPWRTSKQTQVLTQLRHAAP